MATYFGPALRVSNFAFSASGSIGNALPANVYTVPSNTILLLTGGSIQKQTSYSGTAGILVGNGPTIASQTKTSTAVVLTRGFSTFLRSGDLIQVSNFGGTCNWSIEGILLINNS